MNTTLVDIYNASTLVHSGIDYGLPYYDEYLVGPDCWYFWYSIGGSILSLKRVGIDGSVVSLVDPTQSGGTYYYNCTDTGFVLYAYNGISFYTVYNYDAVNSKFVRKVTTAFDTPFVTTTYAPRIMMT